MKRIAVAALLAALLLAACSRGPAAVDEEAAGPLPEASPVVLWFRWFRRRRLRYRRRGRPLRLPRLR